MKTRRETRRHFLGTLVAGGAGLALPARLSASTTPDVVVIGAGSAGLAAALTLLSKVDFGLGELRKLFGNSTDKHFVKGEFTPWANNPLTLGGYAAARPGRASARDDLKKPLAERLFFAGEACAGAYVATCGGAFMSGRDVPQDLIDAIET